MSSKVRLLRFNEVELFTRKTDVDIFRAGHSPRLSPLPVLSISLSVCVSVRMRGECVCVCVCVNGVFDILRTRTRSCQSTSTAHLSTELPGIIRIYLLCRNALWYFV